MSDATIDNGGGVTGGTSGGGSLSAGAPAVSAGGNTPNGLSPNSGGNPSDWTTGLNDELKGFVQNKGFKDPGMALESYRNLEKLMGAPKERLLKLPEKADDPAWNDVYGRLGRPEKAQDYGIKGDEKFVSWAQENFHKLGLSKTQAEKLVENWGNFTGEQEKARLDASQAKAAEEDKALKNKWGQAYEKHTAIAKQAVKEFGMTAEAIDKLESAMGYTGVMELMYNIGSKLGEPSFVAGGNKGGGFNVMSPEAAKSEINSLRSDPDFVRRYTNNDAEARAKMIHLHKMAYGD